LFITAAGMPGVDTPDLVRPMAGRYRLPDALRGAGTPRAGGSARSHTDRPPAWLIHTNARIAANEYVV
jgi:hypothetical protein